jgi:hypothetical protein
MSKPNGFIFYNGASMLDGKPIVGIATGFAKGSSNAKTGGDLIQTWILRSRIDPRKAANTGGDASICGDCPHRGQVVAGRNVNRSCYVTLFHAPRNIYETYKRGVYKPVTDLAETFAGRGVRLGAYGDPAAIPFHIWESVMSRASFGTGYTHQWRNYPELARYCMASADSEAERVMAHMLGFRTFRVRALADPVLAGEVICPASAEAGHKTICSACKACGGTGGKARADIVIRAHGAFGKTQAFERNAVAC